MVDHFSHKEEINQETNLNIKQNTGVLIVRVIENHHQTGLGCEGDIIQKLTVAKRLLKCKRAWKPLRSGQYWKWK